MGTDSPGPCWPRTDLAEIAPPAWVARATAGFVALGLLLRVVRYLLDFPLWCDETMLAANFLDKGYGDLLTRPLEYRQVGPLLFLLVELTAVKLLGFSEWSLRLFPFLCGLASVPLFRHVAGRLLGGVPLMLAVAVFAVSGWPLRYAAEVKPYATDLLVALGLLAMAIEWRRAPDRVGWLWALAAAGPVAVGLSLPAVFTVGGVAIVLARPVWRSGRNDARAALATFALASGLAFLVLLRFYRTAPQDHDYFHHEWAAAFPPLANPLRLAVWLLDVHTGFMFAYPEGGANGLSGLTTFCVVVGAVLLWRGGARPALALLLAPFGLALFAAAVHRYPYGFSARTTQYAAPAICLLMGSGLAGLARSPIARRRGVVLATALLAGVGGYQFAKDILAPYHTATDERARSFARWLWAELGREGEVACIGRDLGVRPDPKHWTRDATDTYLCYQRLYSPRHRRREPLDLSRVSAEHPLFCVLFNEIPVGKPALDAWLAGMLARYDLRGFHRYPVHATDGAAPTASNQLYLVYEFVPKAPAAVAQGSRAGQDLRPVRR